MLQAVEHSRIRDGSLELGIWSRCRSARERFPAVIYPPDGSSILLSPEVYFSIMLVQHLPVCSPINAVFTSLSWTWKNEPGSRWPSKRLIFHWEASPKNIICRDIAAGSKYPTKWQYQRVIDGPCRGQYPNMRGHDAARELRKIFGNVVKLRTKVVLATSIVASF